MRSVILSAYLAFVFCTGSFSQIVTVVDNEDSKPISDVAVLNEPATRFTYTNRSGKSDISSFEKEPAVCFQHFTYEKVCLSYDEIRKNGFQIRLNKKIFAFEEFVVSANRWEQNRNEVPNKITIVTRQETQLQNPQTTADLLGISDEIFIQKSQLGGGSPMIRGFATNRILIVVDGVRMNNAIYREGNIQNVISLDPALLESTEIIFGPGASVYGSDAIGGVMDFHTKNALFSTGKKIYVKADAYSRYSTANSEKTFHLDFNLGGKRIAFFSGITWSDYGDLKMGSFKNDSYLRKEYVQRINGIDSVFLNSDPRIQKFSGYRQLNLLNKFRYRISDNIDLLLSSHYSGLSDVPRYDRLIQYKSGKLRYAQWYYGPQIWAMNSLQLNFSGKNKLYDKAKLIAAYQNYSESRHDRSLGNISMNEQFEKVDIYSVNVDFDKSIKKEKQLLYYGFEFVRNNITSEAQTKDIITSLAVPAGSRYPNGSNRYSTFAIYSGYKNNLSDAVTIITGLRYNYAGLHSTIADNSFYNFPFRTISIKNSALTGSAGLVVRFKNSLQLNLNAATGFRAPNLDDAGKIFDSAPGVVVVPNPDLKPEYAYNIDLGISQSFGEIFHLDITGFHTWLTNAMIRHDFLFNGQALMAYNNQLSKVEAVTNAGSARAYGVHFSFQSKMTGHILLKSSLNITEGKEEGGTPLRHAAPVFGAFHILAEYPKFRADLYSNYNGARRFSKMPPSEIEKPYLYATDSNGNPWSPGWFTLNIKLSYTFAERYIINGGIENILDQRYRPYSSGIAAPGRNLIISARIII
jgi:hemoglobin/transferrin/lactoferrin receptor protein